jgi:F-type H+-transporting ATPase subunit delta
MAENVTVARPYADALFQLARDTGRLSAWSQALAQLAAIAADSTMAECFRDPELSANRRAELIGTVAGDVLGAEEKNFVRILAENDRLSLLPEIRQLFDVLKDAHEGAKEAAIESAFPLNEAATKTLVADLEKKFGCRIHAKVTVEPELIGGVRIAVGDQVIDASVRGKLAAMATAIKN